MLSVVLIDGASMKAIKTIYTSPPLDKYSFDHFTQYSPPVHVSAHGLGVSNEQPIILALQVENNQRNLQIPIDKAGFNATVRWVTAAAALALEALALVREWAWKGLGPELGLASCGCTWPRPRLCRCSWAQDG